MGWFNFTTGAHLKIPDYGLSFEGVVTTYTDTTHFKVSTLAGKGTGFFIPTAGTPYEIFVVQADGAAPEGEQTPVVAYTSSDGTFQHAAFTVPLAVGDIVLIIHPLLASLGTKATDAAADAVTTTDYLMAYIKQIVTQLLATDVVADSIEAKVDIIDTVADSILANVLSILVDYLSHGTHGLSAIHTDVVAVKTDTYNIHNNILSILQDYLNHTTWGLSPIHDDVAAVKADTYNIHNNVLSILTDYLAHGTRGLDALVTLINAVNTQVLVAQKRSGLCYWGQITSVASVTEFTSTGLSGLGVDAMPGWYVYVVQADDGAPEGELKPMSDYTDAGVVTHTAFTTGLAAGDRVILLHPSIAMLGAVDTAAATGAVTTTDYLMAYVKQLVTLLIAQDVVIDNIHDTDLPAVKTDTGNIKTQTDKIANKMLFTMDFWSASLEEVSLDGDTAATITLPTVTVVDLPTNAAITHAIVMFKFRMIENTHATIANKLDGATSATTSQVIQIDKTGATFIDAINFVDDQFGIAAATREGGDVIIGSIDVATEVDANDTYELRWLLALADEDLLNFNDVQVGIRIWYSV